MKYYRIRQDRRFSKWTAMLPKSEYTRLNLSEHIVYRYVWETPTIIMVKMISSGPSVDQVVYGDTHAWKHDLSLDMVPWPDGNIVIISPRFRRLLEEYNAPEYRMYPIHMTNFNNDADKAKTYDLLHIANQCFESLLYEKVTFVVREIGDRLAVPYKQYKMGEISSYSEFLKTREEVRKDFPSASLVPLAWVYEKKWDFLWDDSVHVVVSEEIKKRAEQEGFVGILFEPYEEEVITGAKPQ